MRRGLVACVAFAFGLTLGGASARAQCSTVDGDMNGIPDDCPAGTTNVIIGDATSETITGTAGNDCIFGLGGDDNIDGLNGNDYICGGTGDDTLVGGQNNDTLFGEAGADNISGGLGDDTIDGGADNDTLNGEGGFDTIFGQGGIDTINGGGQDDQIFGGDGDDILNGGGSNDTINGEAGADQIFGDGGNDILNGGDDADNIQGGSGDDTINGGPGDDVLNGRSGNDTINGGDGLDNISGLAGNDILNGDGDADTINGGDGDDIIDGGDGNDNLFGNNNNDTISGGLGDDFANGGTGNDILNGGDGSDTLLGNLGDDTINGEGGNDALLSGSGGFDIINGGSGSDTIFGGADPDELFGGTGDDTINGDAGVDQLFGNEGNDTLNGGAGNDTLWGGPGAFDSADGSFGIDNCLQASVTVNCELSSRAIVDSFGAIVDDGSVVLRWVTSSESSTLGFYVYREVEGDWVPAHDGVLPAVFGAGQGAVYDLRLAGVEPEVAERYLLVEVGRGGARADHGPYEVTASVESSTLLEPHASFAREAHALGAPLATAKSITGERQRPGEASGIYFGVETTGVYQVSSGEIAARLGLSDEAVHQRLQDGAFELTEGGVPVAWAVSPDGGALRFVGFAQQSLFSRERLYHLSPTSGIRMTALSRPPVSTGTADGFVTTVHVEEDRIPAAVIAEDGRADYWFWALASASPSLPTAAEVEIELEGVVRDGSDSALRVELKGATDVWHEAEVELNGSVVGTTTFFGEARHIVEWSVPASTLFDGLNSLRIVARGSEDSEFFLDSADVVIERSYQTALPSLEFAGADSRLDVVGEFGSDPLLFDISNPQLPRIVEGFEVSAVAGGSELAFEGRLGERYLAASEGSVRFPTSIWSDLGSELRSAANRADHLVIAPAPLYESSRTLVDHRRADGLRSMLVELQDVFDEFSDGVADPQAIGDFLRYAHESWAAAPRYVVLVGKGSLDHRDIFGAGGNLIPPTMVPTHGGLYSADNRFGDLEGINNVPEIAIGRLPVTTVDQLDALIGRIIAYEAGLDDLSDEILMIADDDDKEERAEFDLASDRIAEPFADDWSLTRAYRSEMSLTAFRSAMFEGIERSPRLVHYIGHAGLDRWGQGETLFQSNDVGELSLKGAPPVYMMMTCSTSRYEVPGTLSLGETLVLDENGAIAVWGPSGLSTNDVARELAEEAFDHLLKREDVRLGDAVLGAFQIIEEGDPRRDEMPAIYHLFGDPALRVSKARDASGPGGPGDPNVPGDGPGADGGSGGCAVGPASSPSASTWLLLLLALALGFVRRRR